MGGSGLRRLRVMRPAYRPMRRFSATPPPDPEVPGPEAQGGPAAASYASAWISRRIRCVSTGLAGGIVDVTPDNRRECVRHRCAIGGFATRLPSGVVSSSDPALASFWLRVALTAALALAGVLVLMTGLKLSRSSRAPGLAICVAGALLAPVMIGVVWMSSAPTSNFRPAPLPQARTPERRQAENATPVVAERIRARREERITAGQDDLDAFRQRVLSNQPAPPPPATPTAPATE